MKGFTPRGPNSIFSFGGEGELLLLNGTGGVGLDGGSTSFALRALATAVRRGVQQAGGLALEFGTTSLGENLMKPTTMLYRNLMAMDVEECIRSYPIDAVVLLAGCDKTVPAELMGAASVDIPAIMVRVRRSRSLIRCIATCAIRRRSSTG